MSRIVDIFNRCNTLIREISLEKSRKGEPIPYFDYFNIWDDQINEAITGDNYSFGNLAAFVEFAPGTIKPIGAGFSSYPECVIRIHIAHFLLDGGGDTMEANLPVITSRDLIKNAFQLADLPFCSTLQHTEEMLDYKHKNVYKYILGFSTNFIDDKGSIFDPSKITKGYIQNPEDFFNLNLFKSWQSGKQYESKIGDVVIFENKDSGIYFHQSGAYYVYGDSPELYANVVSYQGSIYIAIQDSNDLIFDSEKWMEIKSWIPGNGYAEGDLVFYNSKVYRSIETNENTDFDFNLWELIAN